MAWLGGALLLLIYALTLAPGVTFWDAGEFIAAAHVFGIPHPPGTPLFIAAGRAWTLLFGSMLGVARASNLLSAACTALAGAVTAWMVARETARVRGAMWGALAGVLCAGLATTVWSNATETEVYAVSLLHVTVLLACALRAGAGVPQRDGRWLLCTAYLIALAPAVHLSALIGAPAAILLASRRRDGPWCIDRILLLGGVLVASAGLGRMSWPLLGTGCALALSSVLPRRGDLAVRARPYARVLAACALAVVASSALLILLVRARHDPAVNQGNPTTLATLADVVARRQYDVAALWPRQAPVWLQAVNVAQYADWQFAFAWGDGIFTTPLRLLSTLLFVALGACGWFAMRRDARQLAEAVGVLVVCGSLGVCGYLNLKAGASIGYGFVPDSAHEARERDYFFVLAFWGWGVFAGYGAFSQVCRRRWPAWLAVLVAVVPLAGNWSATDRSRGAEATAARTVALALLHSAPLHAVLFVAGDNDTYPLWYLQQVEGVRRDVTPVTVPLLPAAWYGAEIARRTGLQWPVSEYVAGAKWLHEEQAALIARAAQRAGRPVAASAALGATERLLLGSDWRLHGVVYVSNAAANGLRQLPTIDTNGVADVPRPPAARGHTSRLPDDVTSMMLGLLDCRRLAEPPAGGPAARDSLEVRCNFR